MDIDKYDIEQRLQGRLSGFQRLVFWEDPAGDYAELVGELAVDGATVLDITGRELASKRRVLRCEPQGRFVLYRSGGEPDAADDLVYDLKLAATPFSCSMEGLWAEECGIAPDKAPVLADHAAFFKSKERRQMLSASTLPKGTEPELRFAMAAAVMRVKGGTRTDAVRDMVKRALKEWARGDSSSMERLAEAGLAQTFWQAVRECLGYEAPQGAAPTVDDLAFRMLEAKCSALIEDPAMPDPAECSRILDDLARTVDGRPVYEKIAAEHGTSVRALIPEDSKSIDALGGCDALREFDEWILASLASAASTGSLDLAMAESLWDRRRGMIWAEAFKGYYACILAAGRFAKELQLFNSGIPAATTLKALFDGYCDSWHMVDTRYREFFTAFKALRRGRFRDALCPAADSISHQYSRFLEALTDKWQAHLMDEGHWPPAGLPSQDDFFHDYVEMSFPRAADGKRVGVIVSDALRYEAGVELARRINASKMSSLAGRVKASCEGSVCMLPSYTQLGMAALLPDGPMEIDPSTLGVRKSGVSTMGSANRQKAIRAKVADAAVLRAIDLLEGARPDLSAASVTVIYHNVIDKTGDSRETETKVLGAVRTAFDEIEEITAVLMRAGCDRVFVTADHGFLYQDDSPEDYLYADVPNLAQLKACEEVTCDHTRRFVVGEVIPESDMLVTYTAIKLSLEGDYSVAMPKGITRLRLKGSGSRFVHGGASLQENVIPVLTVQKVAKGKGSHTSEVQGFPVGGKHITGSMVPLIVYQCEPCGLEVSPVTVKVGIYSEDGKLLSANEQQLTLSSSAESAEARKQRLRLNVTNDVDSYETAVVRISAQVGSSSAYKPVWEEKYNVNRAFSSDF